MSQALCASQCDFKASSFKSGFPKVSPSRQSYIVDKTLQDGWYTTQSDQSNEDNSTAKSDSVCSKRGKSDVSAQEMGDEC